MAPVGKENLVGAKPLGAGGGLSCTYTIRIL